MYTIKPAGLKLTEPSFLEVINKFSAKRAIDIIIRL